MEILCNNIEYWWHCHSLSWCWCWCFSFVYETQKSSHVLCKSCWLFFPTFSHKFQEWVEEEYPTYANGPGYIVSSDIAQFIVSEFEKRRLKVCLQFIVPFFLFCLWSLPLNVLCCMFTNSCIWLSVCLVSCWNIS